MPYQNTDFLKVSLCVAPHALKADASTLAEESIQVSQTQVSTSDLVFMRQAFPLIQHNICVDCTNMYQQNVILIWSDFSSQDTLSIHGFANVHSVLQLQQRQLTGQETSS